MSDMLGSHYSMTSSFSHSISDAPKCHILLKKDAPLPGSLEKKILESESMLGQVTGKL
jgi:hypothetical protein